MNSSFHEPGRRSQLDGLRAICFLAVFASHAAPERFPWGGHGVLVFFALSGFLITGILKSSETGTLFFDLQIFYTRRSFRIFPLYFLALIYVALSGPFPDWPWYASYAGNFRIFFDRAWPSREYPHLWTLAVEEQFYLLWPLLFWLTPERARLALALGLLAFSKLCRAWLVSHVAPVWILLPTPICGEYLLWGCVVAILPAPRRPGRILALGCFLFVAWTAFRMPLRYGGPGWLRCIDGTPDGIGSAFLVQGLWSFRGPVVSVLTWRPLAYLGRISYGLYVIHPFALHWTHGLSSRIPGIWPVPGWIALLLTIAVASASWYGFERPMLRIRHYFERPRPGTDKPTQGKRPKVVVSAKA